MNHKNLEPKFNNPKNKVIFEIFIKIVKDLNQSKIIPTIYGSLGLYFLIEERGEIDDVDMLIDNLSEFGIAKKIVSKYGFYPDPNHEREFSGNNTFISFLDFDDITKLVGKYVITIPYKYGDIEFKNISLQSYLDIYESGLRNKYRFIKKEKDDLLKIRMIKDCIKKHASKE